MSRDLLPDMMPQKAYQPMKWTARHDYMVQLELAGFRPGEIAELTQTDPSRVSVILNDDRAQVARDKLGVAIAEKMTDVHMQFRLHASEAVAELVEEMRNCEDARVRQKSAIAILDRAGYSKYQGEHIPKPDLGAAVADRVEKAIAEINAAPGPS